MDTPPCVGLDLVEPQRLEERIARTPSLLATLFTHQEISYCDSQADPIQHFAARFCAKEAIIKALGIDGWDPQDVEIVSGGSDTEVQLYGEVADTAERLGLSVAISMSHLSALAGAVAVARPQSDPSGLSGV
jgi:holo-[acyl-carrier protein] synthase